MNNKAIGDREGGPVTPAVTRRSAAGDQPSLSARRPELDVTRAFVVAGLVVFHSAVVLWAHRGL